MTTTLSPSGLRKGDTANVDNWGETITKYNIDRLNNTLLKISGMGDVQISSLQNEDLLVWDSSLQKYKNVDKYYTTTTTTTTTSSTTTTTA